MLKSGLKSLRAAVHLELLARNGMLCGGEVGVLRLRGGEDVIEGYRERRFLERHGFDIRRGLRAVDELFELRLKLAGFEMVHGNITQEFRLLHLRLQNVLLIAHAGAVARVGRLLDLSQELPVVLEDGERLRKIRELVIGGLDLAEHAERNRLRAIVGNVCVAAGISPFSRSLPG